MFPNRTKSEAVFVSQWINWAGNVVSRPRRVERPQTLEELRQAVVEASRQGWKIRVAGAGHSFSLLCDSDGLILDLSAFTGIEAIDPETGDVAVRAGSKIHELGSALFAAGRAFANQGDIDRQAIAGAVATGTHGTGRRFGSFSNAVMAVTVMTASGDLATIDRRSTERERRAAALGLGMLGVATSLRLATVPAYKLRERTRPMPFEECMELFSETEMTHRNAEFWWVPPFDTCVLKTFAETGEEPFSLPEEEHPPGMLARYLKADKVDWSHRVYPSARTFRFVECEHSLPIARGPEAVRAVRAMMQARHPDVQWAVEYRTLAGEDHLLSPTQGVDCATISVHHAADAAWEPFMRDADALLSSFGGRPHWGKLHWLGRADVDRLYPHADEFRAVRAALDPEGRFLNRHLRALFG